MTLHHFVLPMVLTLAAAAPASALQAHQQPAQQPSPQPARSSATADWQVYLNFHEDRVAIQTQKLASGQYRVFNAAWSFQVPPDAKAE